MSTENTIAERLLEDARKRTAKNESPTLGKAALIVGGIALLVSWISILGWIFGATAIGLGRGRRAPSGVGEAGQDRHGAGRRGRPDRRLLLHPERRDALTLPPSVFPATGPHLAVRPGRMGCHSSPSTDSTRSTFDCI